MARVIVAGLLAGALAAGLALRLVGAFAFAPTPPAAVSSCRDGGSAGAYALLEAHRPDVLIFYAAQGWHPLRQCRQIFDDWLAHAPEGRVESAAEYVRRQGWQASPAAAAPRGH